MKTVHSKNLLDSLDCGNLAVAGVLMDAADGHHIRDRRRVNDRRRDRSAALTLVVMRGNLMAHELDELKRCDETVVDRLEQSAPPDFAERIKRLENLLEGWEQALGALRLHMADADA